jgi:hypothetical protein
MRAGHYLLYFNIITTQEIERRFGELRAGQF